MNLFQISVFKNVQIITPNIKAVLCPRYFPGSAHPLLASKHPSRHGVLQTDSSVSKRNQEINLHLGSLPAFDLLFLNSEDGRKKNAAIVIEKSKPTLLSIHPFSPSLPHLTFSPVFIVDFLFHSAPFTFTKRRRNEIGLKMACQGGKEFCFC